MMPFIIVAIVVVVVGAVVFFFGVRTSKLTEELNGLENKLVSQLLPKSAYDPQLLQRIKDEPRRRSQTLRPGQNGVFVASNGQAHVTNAQGASVSQIMRSTVPMIHSGSANDGDDLISVDQTIPIMNRKPAIPQRNG